MNKHKSISVRLLRQGFVPEPELRAEVWRKIHPSFLHRIHWQWVAAAACMTVLAVGLFLYEGKDSAAALPGYHPALYMQIVSQQYGEAGPRGLDLLKAHISFR